MLPPSAKKCIYLQLHGFTGLSVWLIFPKFAAGPIAPKLLFGSEKKFGIQNGTNMHCLHAMFDGNRPGMAMRREKKFTIFCQQEIRSVEHGICPIAEFTSPWRNCAAILAIRP